jgi:hypothetical protein
MISKTLAAALIAGCVTAAGGGAYLAVRHNNVPAPALSPATEPAKAVDAAPSEKPVSETEATIPAQEPQPLESPVPDVKPAPRPEPVRPSPTQRPVTVSARTVPATPARTAVEPRRRPDPVPEATPTQPVTQAVTQPAAAPAYQPQPTAEPVRYPEPAPAPPEPQFVGVVVPAAAVIGLQVDTPLSSERTQVEDRVDARVTRDVLADGRVAIPEGSRVIGAVTLVERGGKMKERARLGVRFHTLVLGDGTQVPLRTESIIREGEAPSGESARKIGGAAIGGAILGAIMGGGKGAILGGATGAGAGTAAVMTGDRNAATLPAGAIVTVRLASPATIEIEKR